jgi:predicted ATPase
VVADDSQDRIRYRLLETVRHYALEKLGESGEADDCAPATAITTRRWRPR